MFGVGAVYPRVEALERLGAELLHRLADRGQRWMEVTGHRYVVKTCDRDILRHRYTPPGGGRDCAAHRTFMEDGVGVPARVTIGTMLASRAIPTAESMRSWRMRPSVFPAIAVT